MNYLLTKCGEPKSVLTTNTDFSMYVGKVVTIEKYDGCYIVSETLAESLGAKKIINCYDTCDECAKEFFILTDCSGNYPSIYTSDSQLVSLEGAIIKIPFYDNHCFLVTKVPYDKTVLDHYHIDFSNHYTACTDCYERIPVSPSTDLGLCDSEKIQEVKCSFVNSTHQKVMERKYGIKPCCAEDKIRTALDKDMLEHDLLLDPDPELPEPYIESCCIKALPIVCGCHENTVVTEISDCNCEASENSPHDCHQYLVTTTPEEIALAIGNDETYFNNKVFFVYFKCKETKPTQVVLEANSSNTYCTLGIPIKGYFANNVWVDLLLVRGVVCEEIINTLNCHNND